MNTLFHEHAISCGINMAGKTAISLCQLALVPRDDAHVLAEPIIHPETGGALFQRWEYMDATHVRTLQSMGVDYVIVWDLSPTPETPRQVFRSDAAAYI